MSNLAYGTFTITNLSAVTSVDVYYYNSTSSSSLSGGSWSTDTPTWTNGKYIWSKTVTTWEQGVTTQSEPVCITGQKGSTGATGQSVTEITQQYALGSSSTTAPTTGWSTTMPTFESGKFYWTRSKIVWANPVSTTYTTAVLANGITSANTTAAVANTNAQSAVTTANSANSKADNAISTANTANETAQNAVSVANGKSTIYYSSSKPTGGTYKAGDTWFHLTNDGYRIYEYDTTSSDWVQKSMDGKSITAGTVTAAQIQAGAITTNKLATDAIKSTNYQAGIAPYSGAGTFLDLSNGNIYSPNFGINNTNDNITDGAYIKGSIYAYNGTIGQSNTNYWYIGNYRGYDQQPSAYIKGNGTATIQLGSSGTWRLNTNRIHTAWNDDSNSGNAYRLHYPIFEDKYWDMGVHVPTSKTDKFLYIRSSDPDNAAISNSNTLENLSNDINDAIGDYWNYQFYVTSEGNLYAKNLYILDDNGGVTQIAGTSAPYLLKSGGDISGNLTIGGTLKVSSNILNSSGNNITLQTSLTSTAAATLTGNSTSPISIGVTGTLPTSNGGTGNTSYNAGGVVYADNSSPKKLLSTAAGTSGYLLKSGGTGAPSWVDPGTLTVAAATKATQDEDGNVIKTTYLKLTGGNITGPVSFGDSVSIDDLNAGNLVVTGNANFVNGLLGTLNGNATTASSIATAGTIKIDLTSSTAVTYTNGGNITPGISGILPLSNGGTGNNTYTSGGVIYTSNTNPQTLLSTAAGTSGQLLSSGGSGAPSWINASSLTVNHATTASKFNSNRSISLTGEVTGTAESNGENGWSISTTVPELTSDYPYQEVEWVESNGKQYVYLDWKPPIETWGFYADFIIRNNFNTTKADWNPDTNVNNAGMVFGTRNASSVNDIEFGTYSTNGYLKIGGSATIASGIRTDKTRQQISLINTTLIKPDGTTATVTRVSETANKPYSNMTIFAFHEGLRRGSSGSLSYPSTTRIYSLKFYEGETMVVNLVGAIRKRDGTTGLYDKISKHFYPAPGMSYGDSVGGIGDKDTLSECIKQTFSQIVINNITDTRMWQGTANELKQLEDGQRITVIPLYGVGSSIQTDKLIGWDDTSSNSNVFIKLTLKDNSTTDWIPCYYKGTTRLTTHYDGGMPIILTYRENIWSGATATSAGSSIMRAFYATAQYYYNTNRQYDLYSDSTIAGLNGVKRYTLCMQDENGRWTSIVNEANKTGLSDKTCYTGGLRLSKIVYHSASGDYASGANTGNIWQTYLFDGRYSLNGLTNKEATTTLELRKSIYLVGTIDSSNGLFYLNTTKWWTQDEPVSDDGYVYILIGSTYGSYYQIYLAAYNPVYAYKNGRFQQVFNSHSIESDVPANAVFTDTTYEFDGTYDSSTNKAATVSTITNAINALDGGTIGTGGAGKTITALSQSNGLVNATFGNISITKSQVSDFPTTWALSNVTGADDLKAIEGLSGTSGLLKKTAANTWTLDTNSYVTSSGITSIQIEATSPVISSTSTVQNAATASTTISLADAYGDTKNPYASKTARYVLAAPATAAGAPTFRALTKEDVGLSNVLNIKQVTGIGQGSNGKIRVYKGTGTNDYEDVAVEIVATSTSSVASAQKLSSYGGSATQPVYIPADGDNAGKPVAISYTIEKSVPSNAVFTDTWNKVSTSQDGYVTKLPGNTTTFLRGDGSWGTPIGTTYTFDGTYNASSNKAATVSTVTNAINVLDGNLNNTTPGAGKTLTAFSQTNGQVSATFGDISITKSQITDFPSTLTPAAHTHGNISNTGTITSTTVTLGNGDNLLFADSSNSGKIERSSITIGTGTTKYLRQDGTWGTPEGTYSLPLAGNGTRGGVQIGYTESGKNYAVKLDGEKMFVTVPWSDTTYSAGTGLDLDNNVFSNTGVIGIKGNKQNDYRTGEVNLTPANLGAVRGNSYFFYGTCSTGAATVIKEVECSDFTTSDFKPGAMICVIFDETNSGAVADLKLDVNSTGAKPIKYIYNGAYSNIPDKSYIKLNQIYHFTYDGTNWVIQLNYNTNTNTLGYQLRTNSMSLPMTDKVYRYRLLFTSADNTHFVPANVSTSTNTTASRDVTSRKINPFGRICYYSSTTAINAQARPGATTLYDQVGFSLGYSFNLTGGDLTLTPWESVYIKCEPQSDGSAIIYSLEPYVQSLPETDDGFIYIFLGVAYSATAVELMMYHPVYWYKNGRVEPYVQNAQTINGHSVNTDVPSNAVFTDTWNALSTSQAGYVSQAPNNTSQFLRGDATWAAVTAANVGLGNVENVALSTWVGSSNLTTTSVGTLAAAATKGVVTTLDNSTNLPTAEAVSTAISNSMNSITTALNGYVTLTTEQTISGRKTFQNLATTTFKDSTGSEYCNINYNQTLGALVFSFG